MMEAKQQQANASRFQSTVKRQPVTIKQFDLVKNILRPKLKIGQPNDRYEQEADRVADQVMRMSDTDVAQRVESGTIQPMQIQRLCPECNQESAQRQAENEEEIQAKEMPGQTPTVAPNLESRINSLKGGGQPLDSATRSFFEPRFGHDFSNVRVHTDNSSADIAKSINARAFTLGNHVVMGAGEFQPKSQSGRRLLGHELTHVVQQRKSENQIGKKIQREFTRQDYENEPHIVTGHVTPERRAEIERARAERAQQAIANWQNRLGSRQESISNLVVSMSQSLEHMEGFKNTLVTGYTSARNIVDGKINDANATRTLRATLSDFILGLLPGVRSATSSLSATDFITDMQGLGRLSVGADMLNTGIRSGQTRMLSFATSQATSPISNLRAQMLGTQQLPGQSSETSDHFHLRLSETLRQLTLSVLGLSIVGNFLGRESHREQVNRLHEATAAGTDLSGRDQRAAQWIQNAENHWSNFNRQMSRLLGQVNTAEYKLQETSRSWPNHHRFEQMLWIMYIAGLSRDQSEVIDEDIIENRLAAIRLIGNPSILGLDFGANTWLRDTIMATLRAQNFRSPILSGLADFNVEPVNFVLTTRAADEI